MSEITPMRGERRSPTWSRTGWCRSISRHVALLAATLCCASGSAVVARTGCEPPAEQSAVEIGTRIDHLREQGKFSEAVQAAKQWIDVHGKGLSSSESVSVTLSLAKLQVEADQVGDAAETLRQVIELMRAHGEDFAPWEVRTVSAALNDVVLLEKSKDPDRRRLLRDIAAPIPPSVPRTKEQNLGIEARGVPGAGPDEVERSRANDRKVKLQAKLATALRVLGDAQPSLLVASIREDLGMASYDLREWTRAEAEIDAALRADSARRGRPSADRPDPRDAGPDPLLPEHAGPAWTRPSRSTARSSGPSSARSARPIPRLWTTSGTRRRAAPRSTARIWEWSMPSASSPESTAPFPTSRNIGFRRSSCWARPRSKAGTSQWP